MENSPFIVDFPIKNGDFPMIFHRFLYVYQRADTKMGMGQYLLIPFLGG
jgi:hypothetical protein